MRLNMYRSYAVISRFRCSVKIRCGPMSFRERDVFLYLTCVMSRPE